MFRFFGCLDIYINSIVIYSSRVEVEFIGIEVDNTGVKVHLCTFVFYVLHQRMFMDSVLPPVCRQRIDDICLIDYFATTPIPIFTLIAGYLDQPSFFEFVGLSRAHSNAHICPTVLFCNSSRKLSMFIDWFRKNRREVIPRLTIIYNSVLPDPSEIATATRENHGSRLFYSSSITDVRYRDIIDVDLNCFRCLESRCAYLHIESLNIEGSIFCWFTGESFNILTKCPILTSLSLSHLRLSHSGLDQLTLSLPRLRVLRLPLVHVRISALPYLSRLCFLQTLEMDDLFYTEVPSSFSFLSHLKCLTRLRCSV